MSFLGSDDILRVLHGFNPWWTGRHHSVPLFRRLTFEQVAKYLLDPTVRRGVLIAGPRRVGKTTVLYQMAQMLLARPQPPKSILYISLDHPLLKMLSISEILTIYHEHVHEMGEPAFLLLDEVQYSPDWDLHLKLLIDHRNEIRIVATGSAALRQKHDSIDSGVGRWLTVPMPTLSFYEFLQIRSKALPHVDRDLRLSDLLKLKPSEFAELAQRFRPTLPEFQRYLLVGGFPETAASSDIDYCQRIIREDVVERVLKRDMVALFGIRKVNELERLFIYLCFRSGGILSVRTCAVEIGTTAPTVTSYLEALESANLVYKLSPTQTGGKRILREQNKYYLVDAALRNAVLLRGEDVLTNSQELGKIVETAVLRHLYAYHYFDTPEVSYFRDARTAKEVDVIVKSPRYVIPVEVKYRGSADIDKSDGLVKYSSQEPAVRHAYLVTREDKDFGRISFPGDGVRYLKVPAHVFTYLLGQSEHLVWEQTGRKAGQRLALSD